MVTVRRAAAGLALAGLLVAPAVASTAGSVETRVASALDDARLASGAPRVERRPPLDAVARSHAERIAALPHRRRLALGGPARDELDRAGMGAVGRVARHVDMNRGYHDPAAGFLKSWRRLESTWATAVDPAWDAVGVGVAMAEDGWVVLVTVFVEDAPSLPDRAELERRTVEAVNDVRRARGLNALAPQPGLAAVARRHSEDMLRAGYFGHESPGGIDATQRVRAAGIAYRRLSENIHRNRGADDPVATAVDGWLDSEGHRRALLDPSVDRTGVGVAVGEDGSVVFTQLFMLAAGTVGPDPS